MLIVLMVLKNLASLPGRVAWWAYGVLWWALAEGQSGPAAGEAPSGRMRTWFRLTVAAVFGGGVGVYLLAKHDLIGASRAWMALGWMVALVFVGSAFAGTRAGRGTASRPERSIESTLEGASRLVGMMREAGAPQRASSERSTGIRRGWRHVRAGGRRVAAEVKLAAHSGWAGAKHAAVTYRALRKEPGEHPSGPSVA